MEPQTFDFKPDAPKLSKEHAEHILRTLKGLKLTGTYRITKK